MSRFSAIVMSSTHRVVAILGDHGHAVGRHASGSARVDDCTVNRDGSAVEVDQARHHIAELALTVALDTRDPDDLAGVNLDAQLVEHRHPVAHGACVAHDEQRRSGVRFLDIRCVGLARVDRGWFGLRCVELAGLGQGDRAERSSARAQRHLATHHRPRQGGGRGVRRPEPIDNAAVAHDRRSRQLRGAPRRACGYRARPPGARGRSPPQRREQLLALGRGEDRRRLVEDQDRGVAAEALDELGALAQPGGEIAGAPVGIDVEAVVLSGLGHLAAEAAAVEAGVVAEQHVLPHGERLDEAEMLVDHADAQVGGGLRIVDHRLAAGEGDRAVVGLDEPDQDLHQRRLAGAVLAEDPVDPAGVQLQVDVFAGDDLSVVLGDRREVDSRVGAEAPTPSIAVVVTDNLSRQAA